MEDKLYIIQRKLLYKELEPLFAALSSVRYAVVKGEVLSQQIYGVPDRRKPNDIDILIDKQNVKLLEEQLHKLGFEQRLPETNSEIRRNRVLCMAYSHQIPSYHKEEFGFHFNVDVNHDVFWGQYEGQRCYIDEFLGDTVEMAIYGIKVKTLPVEKAFIQLVLHHYKEMNSLYHLSHCNRIRSDLFCDVYHMLLNHALSLNVESVKALCQEYQIGKYIYYMLYYTYLAFSDETLNSFLNELRIYKDTDLLSGYGLSLKERKKWRIPFEERLDNEGLVEIVCNELAAEDVQKIKIEKSIFD